jgi:hypothetical protein
VVHVMDGRAFIKQTAERWDLIIIDAYTVNRYGDTIPPHMTTREFFTELSGRLNADGIVHYHCAFSLPLLSALERTMATVYPHVIRADGELLASRTPMRTNAGELEAQMAGGPSEPLLASLPTLRWKLRKIRTKPLPGGDRAPILTDDYAPVDTLIYGR